MLTSGLEGDCAPVDLLLVNVQLLDPAPDHPRLEGPGWLAIQEGTIRALGSDAGQPGQLKARRLIDGRGRLLMPGLVNGHCHAAMTLFRGLADDLDLATWLNAHIFPAEARLVEPEMVYWCSLLAAAELIRAGTTLVADGYFHEDQAARAFAEAGLRAVAAQGVIDFPAPGVPDPADNLACARRHLQDRRDSELVQPAVFCHSPYTCSSRTIQAAKELAAEYRALFFIHLAESRQEVRQCRQEHGLSPVGYLHRLGVLDPDTVCVHAVWLEQEDLGLLARTGGRVVSCPESNMKLGCGTAPVMELLAGGVTVGIGTDGCASNNDLDLFREMGMLAKLHKLHHRDPAVLPAGRALEMATSMGAAVLGHGGRLGRLIPGQRADLILVDSHQPHLTPLYGPGTLVYAASAADVATVIVNGRLVMEEKQLLTIDLPEVLARVRRLAEGVRR